MKYWKGYKYVVAETFTVQTDILGHSAKYEQVELFPDGRLVIGKGYPWDGNSGPLPDFDSTIEASCAHDVLCDFINLGIIPQSLQPMVDHEYYKICVSKGMWWRLARQAKMAVTYYMTGKGSKKFIRKIHEA